MQPTPQQTDFINAVRSGSDNLSLRAGAGTGKTTTMVMAVNELSIPVLCVAFNKRIATELQDRMPRNAECRTLNSLGHRMWAAKLNKRLTLETKKSWTMADGLFKYGEFPDWAKALSVAKSRGMVPRGAPGDAKPNDHQDIWFDIFDTHDIDTGEIPLDQAIDLLRQGLIKSIRSGWQGLVDFDDQIYLPAIYGGKAGRYGLGLVDESQDLNWIQVLLLERLKLPRLGIVGDPHQAIYGFRGAMSGAMAEIEERYGMTVLPLNITHRCPKAVVREAQRYVPEYYYSESNPEGEVNDRRGGMKLTDFRRPSAVLCRNTKPLINLCYRFLKHGIGASVLGGDIGAGLAKLSAKVGGDTVGQNRDLVWEFSRSEIATLLKRGQDDRANNLRERVEVLDIIAGNLKPEEPRSRIDLELRRLFSDDVGPLTLSTVHKAKGLEWKDVYFLDSHLIPSRFATQPWQLEQESNLAYVAITRAKETLTYVQSDTLTGS